MADLADVLDRAAEVRADELVEVADLERLSALGRDLQREAGLQRHRERPVGALVRAHAAEEDEVLAAGLAPEREHREVERVRAVRDPRELRLRLALVHRDGDQLRVRCQLDDLLVHPAGLAVERAVDGVAERRLDEPAKREPEHSRVVVEDVELACAAGRRAGGMLHLPVRVSDPLARRRVEADSSRARVCESPDAKSVTSCPASDEPVGQERDDPLRAADTPPAAPGTRPDRIQTLARHLTSNPRQSLHVHPPRRWSRFARMRARPRCATPRASSGARRSRS